MLDNAFVDEILEIVKTNSYIEQIHLEDNVNLDRVKKELIEEELGMNIQIKRSIIPNIEKNQ